MPNENKTPEGCTVLLPMNPPEGHEFVAAFTTPTPMEGTAQLLQSMAACYGPKARVLPSVGTSRWVAISAPIDRDHPVVRIEPEQKGDA